MTCISKRGQLTLFIVITVVLVIAIIGFFVFKNNSDPAKQQLNEKASIFKENALDCFNQVYINSLIVAGFQGGYTNLTNGLNNGFTIIPYYYNQGNLNIPTTEKIETELSNYIDSALPYCLNYQDSIFDSEQLGINITKKEMLGNDFYSYNPSFSKHSTKVKINKDSVTFTTNLDLTITTEENLKQIISFNKYPISIDSNIYSMHKIASNIANELKQKSEVICLDCLNKEATENNLTIEFINYLIPEDELVIISNSAEKPPFIFQFLNKYSNNSE